MNLKYVLSKNLFVFAVNIPELEAFSSKSNIAEPIIYSSGAPYSCSIRCTSMRPGPYPAPLIIK